MGATRNKALFFLGIALITVLAACVQAPEPTPQPTQACPDCPDCPTCPDCPPAVECLGTFPAPFEELWVESPHADTTAEAFVHWNEEGAIPSSCARCHSTPGFQDYVGADRSEAGVVDVDAPLGTVIECQACHNTVTVNMSSVSFPSGAEITDLGREAVCMTCHQGRASKATVDEGIAAAGVVDEDIVSDQLRFTNIHYYAAAVSRYGAQVKGGYEYDGKSYDVLFEHVEGFQRCQDCHDPHSLKVRVEKCGECHAIVTTIEDLKNVRSAASLVDYDGDGDTEEGVFYELQGLREMLYTAMQTYAAEVAGTPIAYNETTYPYFFIDTDENGIVSEAEEVSDNAYNAWTARLVKAAYNFQTSLKDPGAFVHGGKYIMQLLYDSIEDLNTATSSPVDLNAAHRIDAGHFAGSEEAFRHWDGDGEVSGSCAKCHSGTGLALFLKDGVNISVHPSNGFLCANCHDNLVTFTRHQVGSVTFPSGESLEMSDPDSNLCINCHQGRSSKSVIDGAIAGKDADTVDESLRFINIHYFAAGATLFGTESKGIYEFDGKEYKGKFSHVEPYSNCTQCHDTHALNVKTTECRACHQVEEVEALRNPDDTTDYDGDGEVEGLALEIATMEEALYAAIQEYANNTSGTGIYYNAGSYPFFFEDTNGNGVGDPDETERYITFTPKLIVATYNYQYVAKDPGAYAHNGEYVMQVLFDTLEYIGTDVAAYTRP